MDLVSLSVSQSVSQSVSEVFDLHNSHVKQLYLQHEPNGLCSGDTVICNVCTKFLYNVVISVRCALNSYMTQ
jgi:hypothetical protein